MRGTTRLDPFRDQIEKTGYAALAHIVKELPIGNVAIGVFDKPEHAIPEYGIGGYHHPEVLPTNVEIDIDPESPYRETALSVDLRKTLKHELHHDARFKAIGPNSSLLDYIISEGLATHYEIQGSHDVPSLYATALKPEGIPTLLERARHDFSSVDRSVYNQWFFSQNEDDIPFWAGYALGFYLVSEYIQSHPNQIASSLYATSPKEFVR